MHSIFLIYNHINLIKNSKEVYSFEFNFIFKLIIIISCFSFFHAGSAKTVFIILLNIISLFVVQLNCCTLTKCYCANFTFKNGIASWAIFFFMVTHFLAAKWGAFFVLLQMIRTIHQSKKNRLTWFLLKKGFQRHNTLVILQKFLDTLIRLPILQS